MKKLKFVAVLFSFFFLLLSACSNSDSKFESIAEAELSKEAMAAKNLLQAKDYKVVAYSKETSSNYVLTEEKLKDEQDHYENHKWKLQAISTDKYIGKTIFNERFIVKNHPLDSYLGGEGKTHIDVIVVDGKAIGGISAPYTKDALVGMPFSLDGKTLDEINNK
jgi:hypothetical protein